MRMTEYDFARGLAVCGVIFYHLVPGLGVINDMLDMLRTPTIFFVAGLFSARSMKLDFKQFLRGNFGTLIWLYLVWGVLNFLLARALWRFLVDRSIDWSTPFYLLIDTPTTIWFLYALALAFLLAWVVRGINAFVVVGLSIVVSVICYEIAPPRDHNVFGRMLQLLPFFLIGQRFAMPLAQKGAWIDRFWAVAVLAFIALAYIAVRQDVALFGPVFVPMGLLGITSVVLVGRRFKDAAVVRPFIWVGSATLWVFVLHRIIHVPYRYAYRMSEAEPTLASDMAYAVFVILLSTVLGKYVLSRWTPWLARAPWTRNRAPSSPLQGNTS